MGFLCGSSKSGRVHRRAAERDGRKGRWGSWVHNSGCLDSHGRSTTASLPGGAPASPSPDSDECTVSSRCTSAQCAVPDQRSEAAAGAASIKGRVAFPPSPTNSIRTVPLPPGSDRFPQLDMGSEWSISTTRASTAALCCPMADFRRPKVEIPARFFPHFQLPSRAGKRTMMGGPNSTNEIRVWKAFRILEDSCQASDPGGIFQSNRYPRGEV